MTRMILTDELLLNYKRCRRRTYLDVHGNLQQRDAEKEFLRKLRRESQTHIKDVLRRQSIVYQKPSVSRRNWSLNAQHTKTMMQQGVNCIYGGMLDLNFTDWQLSTKLVNSELGRAIITNTNVSQHYTDDLEAKKELKLTSHPDRARINNLTFLAGPTLLIKIAGKSNFGDWAYLPVNIKLGRRPKPEYKLIAAFHAQILAGIQGTIPAKSQLILRQHDSYCVNLEYWLPKMQATITDCITMLTELDEPEVFISRQRCSLCHWYNHCYDTAKLQKHLSLIPGVTPKRYEYLTEQGIETLESLAKINSSLVNETITEEIINQLQQQAHSIINNQAIWKSTHNLANRLEIPTKTIELYFDIEAEPELNLDYLLGVLLVDRQAKTEVFYPLLAEKPEEEGIIWQKFLNLVNFHRHAPIFHFSEYEVDAIKRLAKLYGTPKTEIQALLTRFVDLHQLVTESIFLPVESYSLKSVANWIGFEWREKGASGDQCVCWYDRWLRTSDRDSLTSILRYNEDDCRATFHLKDWLVNFLLQSYL